MLKNQIQKGIEYALREKRVPGAPIQRVRVLEHIRGNKWRAEWVEPNAGLIDFVESGQLVVPWKETRAYLKEEVAAAALREHNARQGYRAHSPVEDALTSVFESVGEQVTYDRGILSGLPDALERIKVRAGMDPVSKSHTAYQDRQGGLHLPFDEAYELGRRFSAAEPATVLVTVDATERKWAQEAARPGDDFMAGLLNDSRAGWALIRQWAGLDAAVAQREERIQRLERLIWDAVYALQKAGLDTEAARLRRAVEGK